MAYEQILKRTSISLAVLGLAISVLGTNPAIAEEDNDKVVRKALVERTNAFCKVVLPAWFSSEKGIADPGVRATVADCYMGHARLAILGIESELSLENIALSEVPAHLLHKETGMNLDIYPILAGRTIRTRPLEK